MRTFFYVLVDIYILSTNYLVKGDYATALNQDPS